jgi:hypothetical protein
MQQSKQGRMLKAHCIESDLAWKFKKLAIKSDAYRFDATIHRASKNAINVGRIEAKSDCPT